MRLIVVAKDPSHQASLLIRGPAGRPVPGSDYLHEFLARVAIAL
jgi:hypothetical protein